MGGGPGGGEQLSNQLYNSSKFDIRNNFVVVNYRMENRKMIPTPHPLYQDISMHESFNLKCCITLCSII